MVNWNSRTEKSQEQRRGSTRWTYGYVGAVRRVILNIRCPKTWSVRLSFVESLDVCHQPAIAQSATWILSHGTLFLVLRQTQLPFKGMIPSMHLRYSRSPQWRKRRGAGDSKHCSLFAVLQQSCRRYNDRASLVTKAAD